MRIYWVCSLVTLLVSPVAISIVATRAADEASEVARAERLFKQLDANGDGLVAADEAPQDKRALFDRLVRKADKDGDEKLTAEEFASGLAADAPEPLQPRDLPNALERLRQLDANGDGKIALDEVPERMHFFFEQILDQFDEDGDDALSPSEIRAAVPLLRERFQRFQQGRGGQFMMPAPPPSPLLTALDSNGDGRLDRQEIASATESLRRLDTNGDGVLSGDELHPPLSPPSSRASAQAIPAAVLDRRITSADKNGDGKLSKEEAPEGLRKRFDKLDRNADGLIDQEELAARSKAVAADPTGKPAAKKKTKRSTAGTSSPEGIE
jgi:Ca2+-binding EF-hand superfamily protein